MRNIYALMALTMAVGCGGGDGKDGRDGAQGAMGVAGPSGTNGQDGDNGEPGADGTDGIDGTNGMDGMDGAPGADGGAILQGSGAPGAGLGADGDIYIDTVSRDVYQKSGGTWTVITNLSGGPAGPQGDKGDPGDDGIDGASVLTGSGVPAAGLGKVGDVYIDSATGDLYAKGAGGWAKTGSLKGPAGDDGMAGDDGVDVEDTLQGMRWFAFALTSAFIDAPQLITSETYTDVSSAAAFTFSGANQHGRIASQLTGSYLPGGANLSAFESLTLSASVTGGAVTALRLYLADGSNRGCQWTVAVAGGPDYDIDLTTPDVGGCYDDGNGDPFTLASVTMLQVGLVSSSAGARTLTITDIDLVDSE